MLKKGTLGLLVRWEGEDPSLMEVISDEDEVEFLERVSPRTPFALPSALEEFRAYREEQTEKFGDYVEGLLSNPGVREDIKRNGIQWLHSKMKLEKYAAEEKEAAKLIARFAFQIYSTDPSRNDFWLESPKAKVRVRVFSFREAEEKSA